MLIRRSRLPIEWHAPWALKSDLAAFLIGGDGFIAPPPFRIIPEYESLAISLIEEAAREAPGKQCAGGLPELLMDLEGEMLLFAGRKDDAVRVWQGILERDLTASEYAKYEKQIKEFARQQ